MTDPIRSILNAPAPIDIVSVNGSPKSDDKGPDFSAIFEQAISRVDQQQKDAKTMVESFLQGEGGELHDVILAGQRADLSFQLFLQVRNKITQAYQEVMRMQL